MSVHRRVLKEWLADPFSGTPLPLYYFQRTEHEESHQPDEFIVQEIIDHRLNDRGKMEFLTVWVGYAVSDATWKPVGNFIHQYSSDFVKYCQTNDLDPNVLSELSPDPFTVSLARVKLAYGTWKTEDYAVRK